MNFRLSGTLTVLGCTNATGTHKLKPVLIGKSAKPRCFKNVNMDALPVTYKSCYLYFFCLHCLINIHIFDYPDSRLSGLFTLVPPTPDNRGSTVLKCRLTCTLATGFPPSTGFPHSRGLTDKKDWVIIKKHPKFATGFPPSTGLTGKKDWVIIKKHPKFA